MFLQIEVTVDTIKKNLKWNQMYLKNWFELT